MQFMTPVCLSFVDKLEDLLEDIFNEILVPILIKAFYFLWDLVAGMIMSALNHLLFKGFMMLCKLMLIVEQIFDVFSCTTGVYVLGKNGGYEATSGYVMTGMNGYSDMSAALDVSHNNSLIDVLMQSDYIVRAVLMMTAGAVVLCFLVTIFAVVKSMGEGLGDLKRPVSHVLRQTFKACFTFAVIPIACIFAVKLAGVVICTVQVYMPNSLDASNNGSAMTLVSEALSNDASTPVRGTKQSLIERAIAATREATPGATTRLCDTVFYLSVKDAIRNPANAAYYSSGQHFQNTAVCFNDIDSAKIDYFYAYLESLVVLFLLVLLIV
ncbi:MAG: hypothetical protein IK123_07035, partial [Lachnospiraceae bacterium]|nr:hypothetical protein [Lachnospiraceae bacterium]